MKIADTHIKIITLLALLLSICACTDSPTPPGGNEGEDQSSAAVLVYMAANNSLGLDGADADDLAEMEQAAASLPEGARWIVYHSPADLTTAPSLIELNTDGTWTTLKTYSRAVAVTSERMNLVLDDFASLAPAASTGLVLWSHASGWQQDGIDEGNTQLRSFGSEGNSRMNVTTLARVLADRGFTYIYFDACYMATVEVVYELRHCADYIVASPSELPRDGMPYDVNLALLASPSEQTLIAAATNTFTHYDSQTDPEDRTCTMAVVRTSALDALASATRAIYTQTSLEHPLSLVTNYRGTSRQGYSLDFGEYVTALADFSELPPSVSDAFTAALDAAVAYSAATPKLWNSWPMRSCSGLATYVFNNPSDFTTRGYDALAWSSDVVAAHIEAAQ